MNHYDLLGIIAIVSSMFAWWSQWHLERTRRKAANAIAEEYRKLAQHHDDIILHELDAPNVDPQSIAYSRGVRDVARNAWQTIVVLSGGK